MFALQSATCIHPLAAECFRNGSINYCWEQKVSQWHSLFRLEMEMFIFQHCKVTSNHPPHKYFFFASGLNHEVSGSFPAWQQLERWGCPGLCVLVLCVQTDESVHSSFSGLPVKVLPNWDLLLNLVNFFLVAITVGKKLRLMEKNKDFYESDCVEGENNQNNSQHKPDTLLRSSRHFHRYK